MLLARNHALIQFGLGVASFFIKIWNTGLPALHRLNERNAFMLRYLMKMGLGMLSNLFPHNFISNYLKNIWLGSHLLFKFVEVLCAEHVGRKKGHKQSAIEQLNYFWRKLWLSYCACPCVSFLRPRVFRAKYFYEFIPTRLASNFASIFEFTSQPKFCYVHDSA